MDKEIIRAPKNLEIVSKVKKGDGIINMSDSYINLEKPEDTNNNNGSDKEKWKGR